VVELEVKEGNLVLHVHGADKFWAMKSQLEIPLQHLAGVRADPKIARGWWHGLKLIGTDMPGVLWAGTFYQQGKRIFWDVHDPEKTIVIDLRHEKYAELIVEVADPAAAVGMIQPYCRSAAG
jgi:hypothetical protein